MRFGWLCLATLVACGNPPPQPDAPSSPWSTGPTIPVPRLEPGATALGQRLVVIGGFDTSLQAGLDITTRVDVFDTFDKTWSQPFPDAPVARHHVQVAAIGTTLYLLGGLGPPDASNNFPAFGDSYALDTQDPMPAWRPIAPMPAGFERGSAAVVALPPRIYLFGGSSTTAALATNIYYDVIVDGWCPGTACTPVDQHLPDLPSPRSHPAAMRRSDGEFVVVGGLSGLSSDTQAADVMLLPNDQQNKTGMWTPGALMPQARGGCAYGVVLANLVCAGGEAGTSALSYNEAYDPYLDHWTELPLLPEPRAGAGGAAIAQSLYVVGGASRLVFEPTNTLFIFTPISIAP